MAHIKTRTLLNNCFALNEFVTGLITCFVGKDIIARELKRNAAALPHASFLRDENLVSLFNEGLGPTGNPLSTFDDTLITDERNHSNPMCISVIYYLYTAAVLVPWFFNKGLYLIAKERLLKALNKEVPESELLQAPLKLPQWSIFVELPFFGDLSAEEKNAYPPILRDFGGFMACLQLSAAGKPELLLQMAEQSGLLMERIKLDLSAATIDAAVAPYLQETRRHLTAFAQQDAVNFGPEAIEKNLQSIRAVLPCALKVLHEVCVNEGFTDLNGQPALPHNIMPAINAQGRVSFAARLKEQFFCLK